MQTLTDEAIGQCDVLRAVAGADRHARHLHHIVGRTGGSPQLDRRHLDSTGLRGDSGALGLGPVRTAAPPLEELGPFSLDHGVVCAESQGRGCIMTIADAKEAHEFGGIP